MFAVLDASLHTERKKTFLNCTEFGPVANSRRPTNIHLFLQTQGDPVLIANKMIERFIAELVDAGYIAQIKAVFKVNKL